MDQFGNAAIGVFVFSFFAVIAGLLFHKILSSYLDGSIGGIHCIVIGGLFLGLVVSIIAAPKTPSLGLVAALILLVFVAVPIITWRAEKKANHDFYDEKIESYIESIARDPRNLAAREKLVEAYYRLGRITEAIAVCEQLQKLDPMNRQTGYRLRLLKEEVEEKIAPPKTCPFCGHRNPAGRTHCERCGGLLSLSGEFRKWLAGGGLKKITMSSAVAIGVLAAFGLIMSLLAVPGRILFLALGLLCVIIVQYAYIIRQW